MSATLLSMGVQMNIYEAKTHLSQLVDQAAAGEDVVIARNGRPVARLVPVEQKPGRRVPGAWKGKVWIAPDFDETPQELIDLFYGDGTVDPA
jgi:prevent-host-death family protein